MGLFLLASGQRMSPPSPFTAPWWAFAVALGIVLTSCPFEVSVAASQPNILLVVADDHGWGDVGFQGHPVLKTPHLDAAARAGVRFDRFYAHAPVCSPTRASILTGRHPNRMSVFTWGYPIRPQEVTLAALLQQAGYATGHFGKWHLGSVYRTSPVHPGRMGFSRWVSSPNFFDNDPILSDEGRAVAFRGESSVVTAQLALSWIKEQVGAGRPFFAYVCFGSPHAPHQAAEEFLALYPEQPNTLRHFYGEITALDYAFGMLRQALQDLGIRQQTILWYTSDNGALPKVGSTGGFRGHKGQIYEGGLLVPSILEWPTRFPSPRVITARCCSSDILPTLVELVGLKPERPLPPLDGISLVPILEGHVDQRPAPLGFWHYPAPGIQTPSAQWMAKLLEAQQRGEDLPPDPPSQQAGQLPEPPYPTDSFPGHAAWIEGHWKLHRIQPAKQPVRLELYHLEKDPYETTNVAAEHPDRVQSMLAEQEAWLRSVVASLNGADYASLSPRGEP